MTRYFIFRHVKQSSYKDKIGKHYHFTSRSPNHKKVKAGSLVLIYEKERNCITAIAKVGKVKKKKARRETEYFAIYKEFKRLKNPLFCDEDFMAKTGIKQRLDGKLPGIIEIDRKTYEKVLQLVTKGLA